MSDLDYTFEVKQFPTSEETLKIIECPICCEVPIGPIWLCVLGHSTCDDCRKKMTACAICRKGFTRSRNFVVEAMVSKCLFDCPFKNLGCGKTLTGDQIKKHSNCCRFGKLKWVPYANGRLPCNAVHGGIEEGISLFVIRATNSGCIIPGKLFAHCKLFGQQSVQDQAEQQAIISCDGKVHKKSQFEVLTAPINTYKWVPSQFGQHVPNAIPGGLSETGEQLYIGRVKIGPNVIIGKVEPSRKCCYIGTAVEVSFPSYYILVVAD